MRTDSSSTEGREGPARFAPTSPPTPSGRPTLLRRAALAVLVVLAATAASLMAAELLVRVVLPQNMSNSFFVENEKGLPINRDNGWAQQQVGKTVVRYRFYEHHLRDSEKVDGRTNVLVLGESFTFGMFLRTEESYVGRIQLFADAAHDGAVNFMNAARGGMGVGEYAAFLEDFGDRIRPDAILLFLNVFDIDRGQNSLQYAFDPNTAELTRLTRKPSLKSRLTELDWYQWLHLHSHLFQLVKGCLLDRCGQVTSIEMTYDATSDPNGTSLAEALKMDNRKSEALYRRIGEWARSRNIPLLVVTTGWPQPTHAVHTAAFMRYASTFFEAERIRFCDTRPTVTRRILDDVRGFEIPGDFHPNAAGAEIIARGVWDRCLVNWLPGLVDREAR